jgi:Mg2+/Co2+ transporter CorC
MKNTLQKLIAQFNADMASNLQDIAEILPDGRYAEALDLQTENLTLERVVEVLENELKELNSAQS